ncbi:MAG: alkaline phosphatase family protein, partial [Ardenticatenaceae bacterium]
YEDWIALHIRREQQWFEVLRYLMEEEPTALTALLFDGVDKLQHLCWRFIDPATATSLTEPWERRVREQCLDYFRTVDRLMAQIVSLAGREATVVLASDHGFGPQVRTFFVNAWLAQHGYLRWHEGEAPQRTDHALLGVGQLAKHVYQIDWQHTRAYAPMPSGNGIHIVRRDEQNPHGVPAAEYEPLRDELIAALRAIREPHSGEPVVQAVWKREEIFEGPYVALAPDLTLELQDGGLVSILASQEAVVPRPQPTGTHAPLGIFVAAGPLLRRGVRLPELSILDVPSLLLYSLGVPIPSSFEGDVPVEALSEGALREQPIRIADLPNGSVTGSPEQLEQAPVYGVEEEEEMMKRLRALGYVE